MFLLVFTSASQPTWSKYGQEIIVSGQSFSMWVEICKKEILSTQLGISAAVEDVDDVNDLHTTQQWTYWLSAYKRGYNRYFLQREIQWVNNITRTEALTPQDTSTLNKTERVPFVITYNLSLRSISSSIHKHFHILISSPRCYNVFKAAPIVALDVVVTSAIF